MTMALHVFRSSRPVTAAPVRGRSAGRCTPKFLALSGDQTLTLTALFAQQASINDDADPILIVTPAGQTMKQSATAKSKAKRGGSRRSRRLNGWLRWWWRVTSWPNTTACTRRLDSRPTTTVREADQCGAACDPWPMRRLGDNARLTLARMPRARSAGSPPTTRLLGTASSSVCAKYIHDPAHCGHRP